MPAYLSIYMDVICGKRRPATPVSGRGTENGGRKRSLAAAVRETGAGNARWRPRCGKRGPETPVGGRGPVIGGPTPALVAPGLAGGTLHRRTERRERVCCGWVRVQSS